MRTSCPAAGSSWCATCDGFFFREQAIAVVGGGDSAIEEATFLTRFGSKVYLIHRRDELRASKIMQERAFADPKLEMVWNAEIVDLHGDDRLESVTLRDTVTGETRPLEVTGLFVAIGHDPRSELLTGQVDLDDNGYVLVEHLLDGHQPRRCLRRRRPRRPPLPAGDHRGRDRLRRGARRRALPRRPRPRGVHGWCGPRDHGAGVRRRLSGGEHLSPGWCSLTCTRTPSESPQARSTEQR